MDIIEALGDAISRFEGWIPPGVDAKFPRGSRAWRNRNPGNLRPVGTNVTFDAQGEARQVVPVDDANYRVFATLADGWFALRSDISAKLAGSHGLTDQSTLRNFFDIYAPSDDSNDPDKYTRQVARWLTQDYGKLISPDTTLGFLKTLP
jgi:hypothetical protein